MKVSELRSKNATELNAELIELRRAQFNLRLQRATGQLAKPHQFNEIRKDIARVKTVLNGMNKSGKSA